MSDISSEPGGRMVTATIKYGKGHEEPWIIFRGLPTEVREDIENAFGYKPEDTERLTLAELVLNVSAQANAMNVLAVELGAKAIGSADRAPASAPAEGTPPWEDKPSQEAQGDVWAAAEGSEQAAPPKANQALFDTIESAESVDTLRLMWAENQAAFTSDEELAAAWKAKGKALSTK